MVSTSLIVTMWIAADRTNIAVANIVANAATFYLLLHLLNGMCQLLNVFSVLTQQVQHQS